ncbi:MAC/perforin domain-containing protein [Candidatus Chlamydia corallus]|uniref:MAC/perforin domain-containing protein n=1 Tax=Candidatus Chlamydia corallus TaxID=2038470 RepID=UPI000C2FDF53|nr:MAC/perforin domain-containing protein [Candidatus Chlamydia corallus]
MDQPTCVVQDTRTVLYALNSFDPRLSDTINTLGKQAPLQAENAIAEFIESLDTSSFPLEEIAIPVIPGYHPKFYLLFKNRDDTGVHYEVLDGVFLNTVAACVIQNSLLNNSMSQELLSEVKEALIRSAQTGMRYLIGSENSENLLTGSNSFELVKNTEFLGRALDIVTIDPVNILNSLGTYSALDYSFNEETAIPSSDGRLGLPPGTRLVPKYMAEVNVTTSVFEEKTSFSNTFSTTVTVNVPYGATSSQCKVGFSGANSKEIAVLRRQLFSSYVPKLADLVKKHKRSAKILINKINFGNIWRNQPKSQILTEGDVRLDLQGFDSSKFNYQIQVGAHTISSVLIDRPIADIKISSEQAYAIRKIKSGFQQSLDDCHIYHVGFKSNQSLGSSEDSSSLNSVEEEDDDPMDGAEGEEASKESAFSASFSYEFVKSNTRESKNTVTHSTASHTLYTLRQDCSYDLSLLKVDDEFRYWVEKKLDANDPDSLTAFIKEIGTHYTTSVTYGGVGFQVLKMSYLQVEDLEKEKISVSVAAASSLLKSKTSNETEKGYSSYQSDLSAQTVFLGGTVLPDLQQDKLDLKEWSESVPNEPIPLAVNVSPITDLLVPELFPSEDAEVLSQKKLALGKVILKYLDSHKPKEEGPKPSMITSGFLSSSIFTLTAANSPETVALPYVDYWSTIPYLFPTLKETSGAQPLELYLRFNDMYQKQNLVHNTSYILASMSVTLGYFGNSYRDYDALSFYGSWPQAYFDWSGYTDRCTWTLEKLNTTGDLFIRFGDEIRLKHNASGEYLATTSMSDGYQTLTRTNKMSDAVFIMTLPS